MSCPFELDPSSAFVERYRGILLSAIYELLDRLQSQGVSSKLVLDSGAASFIELVLFDLVLKICARARPQSADDISSYIVLNFPDPLRTRYADSVLELFAAASSSASASSSIFSRHVITSSGGGGGSNSSPSPLVMPVDKLQQMLTKDVLHTRADSRLARYLASLLQVIVNDILVFVRRYVIELQVEVIGEPEVRTAFSADRCFLSIFASDGGAALIGKSSRSASTEDDAIEGADDADKSSMVSIPTLGPGTVCDTISMVTVTPGPTNQADEDPLDYTDQVKRLLSDETANVRDLHTIIRLFKAPLEAILSDPATLEDLFGNVDEVLIAAESVLSTLEDTVEAADETTTPLIGEALLELAGEAVLDVYRTYAETVLSPACANLLATTLQRPEVAQRLEVGTQFRDRIRNYPDCFRYVLPRLLLRPLQHCWKLFEHLEALLANDGSPTEAEDRNFVHQAISVLHPLRARLTPYQKTLQRPRKPTRQQALEEVIRISKSLESWRDKPLQNFCTELVHEGPVFKLNHDRRRNPSERYMLLFDTMILLCKRTPHTGSFSSSSSSSGVGGSSSSGNSGNSAATRLGRLPSSGSWPNLTFAYRVKEKLMLRHASVRLTDLPDCPEYANAFQVENYSLSEGSTTSSSASPTMFDSAGPDSFGSLSSSSSTSTSTNLLTLQIGHTKGSYVLLASSPQEKQAFMYHLLWLLSRPSIDRQLDLLLNEPTQFKLPDSYEFSEPDRPGENIIFEESNAAAGVVMVAGGPPLVRGATLKKLIERLTFHEYSDTRFMKTFATTYRSFCKPRELLQLLISRFYIPEISAAEGSESMSSSMFESATEARRFRKEYVKPVQFRVLNFIRHWILQHSYDFSDDPQLRTDLVEFVSSIRAPHLRRWVSRLLGHIDKIGQATEEREAVFDQQPPPFLYHLRDRPISLMTLHPVELARQVTLLEFAAFRRIRPCELSGTAWTKSTKYETSPNVMRATDFHNEFTYWLERNVVETKNLEERVAVCERIADVLLELKRLNNFSGQFCVSSAFSSSCVHRLKLTKLAMAKDKLELIEDAIKLGDNHYRIYEQRLRMCNPPCVPFLGMWKTRLLHVDEGNRDFLAENVINFNKWRRTADFLTEIQQYQNQPYCLEVEHDIRAFFERLDARSDLVANRDDIDKFETTLYDLSLEIEPKQRPNASPPIFPRRFEFPLTPPVATIAAATAATQHTHHPGVGRRPSSIKQQVPMPLPPAPTTAPGSASRRQPGRAVPLVLATTASFSNDDSSTDSRGPSSSSSSLPGTPFPTPPCSASMHLQHFFEAATGGGGGGGAPPPLPPRPNDLVVASNNNSNSSNNSGVGGHSSSTSSSCSTTSTSGCLLPPPLPPSRPVPSPTYQQHSVGSSSSSGSSFSSMPPPLPPRSMLSGQQPTSAGASRTRFEYPTPPAAPQDSSSSNNNNSNTLVPPERPGSHHRQSSQ